ncbi:MAG: S-layer homology domain-containing protein, partial [Oscillospiraceae bacterium]|nr:S-layer homology domain-containing protein [Oscillospiraceae bacterium]
MKTTRWLSVVLVLAMLLSLLPLSAGAEGEVTLIRELEVDMAKVPIGVPVKPEELVSIPEEAPYQIAMTIWNGPGGNTAMTFEAGESRTIRAIFAVKNALYQYADDLSISVSGCDGFEVDSAGVASVMLFITVTAEDPTISEVTVRILPPKEGEKSLEVAPKVTVDGWDCWLSSTSWLTTLNGYSTEMLDVTFEKGKTYYACVLLQAAGDKEFKKGEYISSGADETWYRYEGCTVEGGTLEFQAAKTFSDGDFLLLKIAVTPRSADAIDPILAVEVGVFPPMAGTRSDDRSAERNVSFPNDRHWELRDANWETEQPDGTFKECYETPFEAGETYYMWIELEADRGYAFSQGGTYGYTDAMAYGDVVLLSDSVGVTNTMDGDGNLYSFVSFRVAFTPTVPGDPVPLPSVDLGFTPPAVGEEINVLTVGDWAIQYPAPWVTLPDCETRYAWYTTGVSWVDAAGEQIKDSFTITAGETYRVRLQLEPTGNYVFADGMPVNVPNTENLQTARSADGVLTIDFEWTAQGGSGENEYFGVWMCDVEQTPNVGGSVAIFYELPDGTFPPDSGQEWTSSTNQTVPKGTKVTLEARPESGYHFKGWYQANIDKANETDPHYLSGDFISGSNPYTFTGNPCGEGYSPYICAVFEKDVELIPVKQVTLYPDRPSDGKTTDTEEPCVGQLEWGFVFSSVRWADSEGKALTAPQTFVDGQTYYIAVTLRSYWASDGHYYFVQGGEDKTTVAVEGGELIGEPAITNVSGQPSTMELLIAVKAMVKRPADQIQIWLGNTDGRGVPFTGMGGKVAVEYTPSEPNVWGFDAKDGTDYVAGEIVQFYPGDEITVYAKADEGYRFVGWYDVNIEWGPEEGARSYQGDVILTDHSITYKPGVTVFEGRTEPQRYVCAVFEAGEETCKHEHVGTRHKDPTCTEPGYDRQICDDCGAVISETVIAALGHNIVKDEAVAPTCTESGLTAGEHCTRCDYKVAQQTVPALGHAWDEGKVTTPATATKDGVKTYTCTRCGATKTEVIPATGEDQPCDGGENCPSRNFKDVNAGDWYHLAVDFAVERGLFKGMTETTFEPNTAMTRGMLVTVLWRYENSPKEGKNEFVDVKAGDWYEEAVAWAAEHGIVTGVGNG